MFEEDDFCVQIKVTILLIYADAGICSAIPIFLALCTRLETFPFSKIYSAIVSAFRVVVVVTSSCQHNVN